MCHYDEISSWRELYETDVDDELIGLAGESEVGPEETEDAGEEPLVSPADD